MQLVVPFRPRQRPDPSLKWVLRTFEHHTDLDAVWLLGTAGHHLPPWLDRTAPVEYLVGADRGEKWANIGAALETFLTHPAAPSEWVYGNDDMFLLVDADELPAWCHSRWKWTDTTRGGYHGHMARLRLIVEAMGFDDPPHYDLHTPLPLSTEAVAIAFDQLRQIDEAWPLGHFRSLAAQGHPRTLELASDVKVEREHQLPDDGWESTSTSPRSWEHGGACGEFLRGRYWRPSRWEKRR